MTDDKKQLEIIGDYWTQRSEGFSEHMLQNMEADEKGLYVRTIREFSDTRKMKVLYIGTGPGLFPGQVPPFKAVQQDPVFPRLPGVCPDHDVIEPVIQKDLLRAAADLHFPAFLSEKKGRRHPAPL